MSHTQTLPPVVSKAHPLIGHALEFRKNRFGLMMRGLQEKGTVFTLKLGPQKAAVLIGPEHATTFFKETDKKLNMAKPYTFLREALGKVAFVADHETYLNQRPTLYAAFTREKMTRYIQIMQREAQKWLNSLPDDGRLELTGTMVQLVQEIAGQCLGGEEFMERVGTEFWEQYILIGKSLDPLLPPNWPLPKFKRRDAARKRMAEMLTPIIRERKAHPDRYDDVLQDMINTPYKNGTPPLEEDLLGLIIALMFAGHETTAGQAAWTITQLLQNPAYLHLVKAEIEEKLPPGTAFDAKKLAEMKKTQWAVDETTRMHPSADMLIRVTDEPLELGEYLIPEGWPVFISTEISGRMESVFSHPHRYDPFRFSPERAEHKQSKNSITGFGGGMHKCVGMSFARNEMHIIAALFFQQFSVALETQNPVTVRDMGAGRPGPTWIRFKRKMDRQSLEARLTASPTGSCPFGHDKVTSFQ